jgi:hypothetical protein
LFSGISKINDHFSIVINDTLNPFEEYLFITINNYYLRPSLVLLIPIIGIFTHKKLGWILIQSYFYFLISNTVFLAIQSYFPNHHYTILKTLIIFVLFLLLGIMNKLSYQNYGIKKSELIGKNIIASVIGISISLILAMLKLSYV